MARLNGVEHFKGGTSAMPNPAATFRLASGIFFGPLQLGEAIDGLLTGGFRRRDMCLAGTRTALGSVKEDLQGVPRQLRSLYPLAQGVEVVGTSGVLLRKLLKEAAWRESESALRSAWLLPELFGRFTEHIRRGAVVLLVSAPDAGLLQAGCRILLRHSTHPVQTHEFTLARSAGA
jgi:hypothetical protein